MRKIAVKILEMMMTAGKIMHQMSLETVVLRRIGVVPVK
uniref:Uncharacterized protein n=1 Tax=Arundo donax TaxID=35708 RepID=A0A0A8YBD0_ARUDO